MSQIDLSQDEIKVIMSVFGNNKTLTLGDAVKMLPIYEKLANSLEPEPETGEPLTQN